VKTPAAVAWKAGAPLIIATMIEDHLRHQAQPIAATALKSHGEPSPRTLAG
jgi:hypothetical protein